MVIICKLYEKGEHLPEFERLEEKVLSPISLNLLHFLATNTHNFPIGF
jgi:hypothetical protein